METVIWVIGGIVIGLVIAYLILSKYVKNFWDGF
jgi:uncharacterized protein YacL